MQGPKSTTIQTMVELALTTTAAQRTQARRLGATLGLSAMPGALYAAWWSGLGDASWHVWVIGLALAALLGALTWPVFIPEPQGSERPGPGFAALFASQVGMLTGAFVAFPMGGVFGFVAGWLSGSLTAFLWSRLSGRPMRLRAPVSAALGGLTAMGIVAWWLA